MKYSIHEKKTAWRLIDDEAVIINTDTSFYYTLNKTGTFIWNLLDQKKNVLDKIVKKTAIHYGKKEEDIVKDVKDILKNLLKESLIQRK